MQENNGEPRNKFAQELWGNTFAFKEKYKI
jgi:hypothetical protein